MTTIELVEAYAKTMVQAATNRRLASEPADDAYANRLFRDASHYRKQIASRLALAEQVVAAARRLFALNYRCTCPVCTALAESLFAWDRSAAVEDQ